MGATRRTRSLLPFVVAIASFMGPSLGSAQTAKLPVTPLSAAVVVDGIKGSDFIGSDRCQVCHAKEHAAWRRTWHANMHRKSDSTIVVADFDNVELTYRDVEIESADRKKVKIAPTIRLSRDGDRFFVTLVDKDDATNNQTYPIAFVLGGNWEQHFEAQVGDRLFATPMRWVVADKQWRLGPFNTFWWSADGTPDGRPKKAAEMPALQVGDAKCDGCHTTGFSASKDAATGRWSGKYASLGVGCESCHGPGSKHAEAPAKQNIVNPRQLNARQQEQLCGQCHSRVTNKAERDLVFPQGFVAGNVDLHDRVEFWTYSTQPGNFWANEFSNKNRQQYQDARFSKHERVGVTCITCHDVHSTERGYAQVRGDKNAQCAACHQASEAMYADSTMAKAGVGCIDCHMAHIANRAGATAKTREFWDVSSHTFRAVMPQEAADYKMRSSCDACHAGDDRTARGAAMQRTMNDVQAQLQKLRASISIAKAQRRSTVDAQALVDQVLLDRSAGTHNPQKAMSLLDAAMTKLSGAR